MKFGYQGGYLMDNQFVYTNAQSLMFRVNNGVPNQITEDINSFPNQQRVRYDALYAQEQWTIGRITLQGALRYDRAWSFYPEATVGPVPFLRTAVTYPATQGVTGYNDITPRGGVAIDVFGNGKTSVKINAGKYLQAAQNGLTYQALKPTGRLTTTAMRAWTDRNGNFVPDCDLLNPFAQSTTTDFCGQISDLNFGKDKFTSTLDPQLVNGWGVRPGDWQIGASVQQELLPRVSVEAGFNRRWLTNFVVTDNLKQKPSDFAQFALPAPLDSRLPGGGGYPIAGLYNVNQNVASLVDDLQTQASNYGNYSQVYNGLLVNISARPRNGLVFQGGVSSGTTRTDYCAVRSALPGQTTTAPPPSPTFFNPTSYNPANPWCNTSTGLVTRYTGLGSYTIPRVDVLLSGTFRSDQGAPLAANWSASNAIVKPYLGRDLSNNLPNVTVNLIEPGTLYGDRVNEIDLRLAKILKFGRTRTNIGFDIYNIVNSAAVLSYNLGFVPNGNWLVPAGVLQPRFWKFSVQVDF
jgi:hypothetical protein